MDDSGDLMGSIRASPGDLGAGLAGLGVGDARRGAFGGRVVGVAEG